MSPLHPVTVCVSCVVFALANRHLPQCLRPNRPLADYQQWKWRNITVSLAHSLISGLCALHLSLDYYMTESARGIQLIHQSAISRQLLCLSIGYFIYDSFLSLCRVGTYPGRVEIIAHHVITMATLGLALLDRPILTDLMPFCVFGLVIELNNVFIHIRSLMELAHLRSNPRWLFLYKLNSATALVSILLFRIIPLVLIHQDILLLESLQSTSIVVRALAHFPVVAIVLISCVIFWRIVQDDFLALSGKFD